MLYDTRRFQWMGTYFTHSPEKQNGRLRENDDMAG